MDVATSRPALLSVEPSLGWRRTPSLASPHHDPSLMIATRWKDQRTAERELYATPLPDHFTVCVPLATSRVSCRIDNRVVHDGLSNSGSVCVTPPGSDIRCWFGQSMEAVHLFVSTAKIVETYEELTERDAPAGLTIRTDRTLYDPVLCQTASLLMVMAEDPDPKLQMYSDTLGAAALTRLVTSHLTEEPEKPLAVGKLPTWRLRLALEFIDENLDAPTTLPQLAAVAGLSPMYFAAQFRNATGLSPHKYLMRKRLERAQELMRTTRLPLAEVAIAVGFSSQTHFTTAFRASVGQTPAKWRQAALN